MGSTAPGRQRIEQAVVTATVLASPPTGTGQHLLLYDGLCGLCNGVNQFVLRHDKPAAFDFASLQSAFGTATVKGFGRRAEDLDTFYVVADYRTPKARLVSKSDGALFVVRALGGVWRVFGVFGALPTAWRDRAYDLVARHRYRLFGRYDMCPLPRPEERRRFIDV